MPATRQNGKALWRKSTPVRPKTSASSCVSISKQPEFVATNIDSKRFDSPVFSKVPLKICNQASSHPRPPQFLKHSTDLSTLHAECKVPIASPRPMKPWPDRSVFLEWLENLPHSSPGSRLSPPSADAISTAYCTVGTSTELEHHTGLNDSLDSNSRDLAPFASCHPCAWSAVPLENSCFALHPLRATGSQSTVSFDTQSEMMSPSIGHIPPFPSNSALGSPPSLPSRPMHTPSIGSPSTHYDSSSGGNSPQSQTSETFSKTASLSMIDAKLSYDLESVDWTQLDAKQLLESVEMSLVGF